MDNYFEWIKKSVPCYSELLETQHWSRQEPGVISVPDFIKLRASGNAMTRNGFVYLKKDGPDPELEALLHERIIQASKIMEDAITESLYGEGNGSSLGLQGLLGEDKKV